MCYTIHIISTELLAASSLTPKMDHITMYSSISEIPPRSKTDKSIGL